MMKGLKQGSIALLVAGLLVAPAVQADNSASTFIKDGKGGDGAVLIGGYASIISGELDSSANDHWYKVLDTELKNSGTPKDLIVGLSFETQLITTTEVKSKGGVKNTDTADARIQMKVLVDGVMIDPGIVVFDSRSQTMWAQFGGWSCTADLGTEEVAGTGIVTCDEEEVVGLSLDTKSAHTFNFLTNDIGSGSHTIEAWARLSLGGDYSGTDAPANNALLGHGTLSVWEVHGSVGTN